MQYSHKITYFKLAVCCQIISNNLFGAFTRLSEKFLVKICREKWNTSFITSTNLIPSLNGAPEGQITGNVAAHWLGCGHSNRIDFSGPASPICSKGRPIFFGNKIPACLSHNAWASQICLWGNFVSDTLWFSWAGFGFCVYCLVPCTQDGRCLKFSLLVCNAM
jgi:hypothetical protein